MAEGMPGMERLERPQLGTCGWCGELTWVVGSLDTGRFPPQQRWLLLCAPEFDEAIRHYEAVRAASAR